MTEIPLEIALNVLETQDAPLEDGYWAGPVSQDGSAVYFQVTDSAIGPNWGVWWEDGVKATRARKGMLDAELESLAAFVGVSRVG